MIRLNYTILCDNFESNVIGLCVTFVYYLTKHTAKQAAEDEAFKSTITISRIEYEQASLITVVEHTIIV